MRKIVLAQNLLRQDKAWYRVPVQLPVPQGTGETSSTDHAEVWLRNRDCNPEVDPSTYVWKGFIKFYHHESTQICEYNEGLLTEHAIYWEYKRRKKFPLFVAMLNMFIFIFLVSTIQELIHWILPVGVSVRVSNYDVNYGVSADLP